MLVHFVGHVCSESKQRSLSIGVRVHILWTIAQQKRDDCMIRPQQAILCLFEEEGAPSSPEQVFLRLSSPPAPRATIATVSRWKFPKKSVRFSIKFSSYSRHFFSLRVIFFSLTSHNQKDTQWQKGSVNGLLLTSPNRSATAPCAHFSLFQLVCLCGFYGTVIFFNQIDEGLHSPREPKPIYGSWYGGYVANRRNKLSASCTEANLKSLGVQRTGNNLLRWLGAPLTFLSAFAYDLS